MRIPHESGRLRGGLQVEVEEAVSADSDGGALLSAGTNVLSLVEFGFLSGRHGYPPPPRVGWAGFVCFQWFTRGSSLAMLLILLGLSGFQCFQYFTGGSFSGLGLQITGLRMKNARASGRFF